MPNNWIVREPTERDYGIDCYVELVNDKNQLTGDIVLVQLKSKDKIKWTGNDEYILSGVKISTTNYWHRFPIPVLLFLTDNLKGELYFVCVQSEIRKRFLTYIKQKSFNYRFKKNIDVFDLKSGSSLFRLRYLFQERRERYETELKSFLSNLEHYCDFIREHHHRDFHLPIESIDLIFFEAMHQNLRFLTDYLLIKNLLPNLKELKKRSKEAFTDDYYDLYELQLTEINEHLSELLDNILEQIKDRVEFEKEDWMAVNMNLFNYVNNVRIKDGQLYEGY